MVLRGTASLDLLRPSGEVVSLPLPQGWPRAVAFGPDGAVLLLTADDAGPATDDGAPFRVVTWQLEEAAAWRSVEEVVTPPVRTVRAVEGPEAPLIAGSSSRHPGSRSRSRTT